jgi:Calx-beta domain
MKPILLLALVVAALGATAATASASSVSASDGGTSVPEGGTAHLIVTTFFTVGLESEPTFNVSLSDGTAVSGADYASLPSPAVSSDSCLGTCTTQYTYDIAIPQDNIHEGNETFQAGVGYTTNGGGGSSATQFTIVDDDPVPTVSINDKTVGEADGAAHFAVSLSNPSSTPIDVPWTTANGSATAPADFTASGGTAHFNPGDTTADIAVPIVNDNVTEPTENYLVNLTAPATGATLADGQGEGKILDNDAPPTISIEAKKVTEGNAGTTDAKFELELSHPSAFPIDVSYHTEDGTAHSPDDYQAKSGTVHFEPLQTEKDVRVPVNGDTTDEPDETFTMRLSSPVNATLGDDDATMTIKDDDLPPTISIGNASVREGDSGTVTATFDVTLSAASGYTITANYGTADDSAHAGSDYQAEQGSLSFAPGQTHKQVTVTVNGDDAVEPDESFLVRLSAPVNVTLKDAAGRGTIVNDDNPAASSDSSQSNSRSQSSDGRHDSPSSQSHSKRQRGPRMRVSIADALAGDALHFVLACPAAEERCAGTATLVAKRSKHSHRARRLGSVRFRIAGGDSREVVVHLSRKARSYLADGGKAIATIVARDADGNVGVTKRSFAL